VASIKQVVAMAGVSIGTVSHVVTGSVPVSEPLRRKVEAAIRTLNYHPNHVARSLRTRRTNTLGMIVPDMTIPFFPQVIRGAEHAARRAGYTLIVVNSDDDGGRQTELLSLLRSQRVEGILLAVAAASALEPIERTLEAGIPIVCVDRVPDQLSVDSVTLEDGDAAELGVGHLLATGFRRIVLVTGPLTLRNERERMGGYERALKKAGLPVEVWEGNLRPEDVSALCREKLEAGPHPDAICATNGPTALGVLRALKALGLRTPGDLGFVTFDELTVDDLFSPAITTVVQPAYEIGFEAAAILLSRIQSGAPRRTPRAVRLPATLRVRESSSR
jgi:DNA-binding LacI/PurR family transcriptional regulator